jgi:HEAT repeat protein
MMLARMPSTPLRWGIAIVVVVVLAGAGAIVWRDWPLLALRHRWPTAEARERGCEIIAERRSAGEVPALMRALGDPEWRVAMGAADALGAIGDRSVVPELMRMASTGAVGNERQFSISALGQLHDARAVPTVILALADPDTLVRRNAAQVLGELKAGTAVDALLVALADPRFGYRGCAARSLGLIGDVRAFEAMRDFLVAEPDQYQASGAAEGLGLLGDRRAVPVLLPFIRDPRFYVAQPAIDSLGMLRDPAAVDALCALASDAKVIYDLRRDAISALGEIGDPRALDTVSRLSAHGSFSPQGIVARGLLGDASARAGLIALLRHDAAWIRAEAARSLAAHGSRDDLAALRALPRDADPKAARAIAAAIRQLEGAIGRESTAP